MSASERIETQDGSFATLVERGPDGAPDIVVVPPLGMPAEMLAPFARRLARTLHVLTIELPGSGGASTIRAGVTTRELAARLVDVLDARGIARTHLFGISLGGMIAQWVAIDAPDRIDRLVLASTTSRGIEAARAHALSKLVLAARALVSGDPGVVLAKEVVADHVRDDPDAMARIEHALHEHPRAPSEIPWLAAAALRHDTRAHLAEIRARTLVVTGADDTIITPEIQAELAAGITGARERTIPAAGHDVVTDAPEAVAAVVASFCRE